MNTKRVLITGANSGMGLASTIELAKRGYEVIMGCRNEERGQKALQEAREKSGSDQITLMKCDLGSLQHIREFAEQFNQKYDRLDVLLNNAGVVNLKRQETEDGFEMSIGVNHLGHFLLTHLLLDALKASPQGRIVVVSSGAYKIGKIHWDDPHLHNGYTVIKSYAQSKIANIFFTRVMAEKLKDTQVTINCLHPGAVATNIGVDRDTGFGKRILAGVAYLPFFQTPEQGAETAIFLVDDSSVAQHSGMYYYRQKIHKLKPKALDDAEALRFWEWSQEQVGLQEQ
ncbi:SDR family oxidoreductase [Paenibacillus sp. KACC 21273]|uniref:SDR family oxidoreductase n=1 Tax=Paenibacillus sp. KACC 21273 TaxID=3025665 RepID=UPI0023667970|nr:SDR family oxidoreductase [Paenibacillus sp. KACC 21273]WDF52033.1 SDR family oxidoreductase [Paenibacillus sp. KACC 21273]